MVGTITYMAPELLQIEPFYNYKIDIWSFGLILHELKRGNQYFFSENNSTEQILSKIMKYEDYPYKDDPLDDIINGCLKKEPEQRLELDNIIHQLSLCQN